MLNHLWNEWSVARSTALWVQLIATVADIGLSFLAVIIVGAMGTGHAVPTWRDNLAGYLLLFFPLVCLVAIVTAWVMFARHSDAHSVIVAVIPAAYLVAGILVLVFLSFIGG